MKQYLCSQEVLVESFPTPNHSQRFQLSFESAALPSVTQRLHVRNYFRRIFNNVYIVPPWPPCNTGPGPQASDHQRLSQPFRRSTPWQISSGVPTRIRTHNRKQEHRWPVFGCADDLPSGQVQEFCLYDCISDRASGKCKTTDCV